MVVDRAVEDVEPGADIGEYVRIADPDDAHRFVACDRAAFELDGGLAGFLELRSFDAHGPAVACGVGGLGSVERAGRFAHPEGVRVLVEHVRGDRGRRAGRVRGERFYGEAGAVDLDVDAAAARVCGAQAAAFDCLRGMPGGP